MRAGGTWGTSPCARPWRSWRWRRRHTRASPCFRHSPRMSPARRTRRLNVRRDAARRRLGERGEHAARARVALGVGAERAHQNVVRQQARFLLVPRLLGGAPVGHRRRLRRLGRRPLRRRRPPPPPNPPPPPPPPPPQRRRAARRRRGADPPPSALGTSPRARGSSAAAPTWRTPAARTGSSAGSAGCHIRTSDRCGRGPPATAPSGRTRGARSRPKWPSCSGTSAASSSLSERRAHFPYALRGARGEAGAVHALVDREAAPPPLRHHREHLRVLLRLDRAQDPAAQRALAAARRTGRRARTSRPSRPPSPTRFRRPRVPRPPAFSPPPPPPPPSRAAAAAAAALRATGPPPGLARPPPDPAARRPPPPPREAAAANRRAEIVEVGVDEVGERRGGAPVGSGGAPEPPSGASASASASASSRSSSGGSAPPAAGASSSAAASSSISSASRSPSPSRSCSSSSYIASTSTAPASAAAGGGSNCGGGDRPSSAAASSSTAASSTSTAASSTASSRSSAGRRRRPPPAPSRSISSAFLPETGRPASFSFSLSCLTVSLKDPPPRSKRRRAARRHQGDARRREHHVAARERQENCGEHDEPGERGRERTSSLELHLGTRSRPRATMSASRRVLLDVALLLWRARSSSSWRLTSGAARPVHGRPTARRLRQQRSATSTTSPTPRPRHQPFCGRAARPRVRGRLVGAAVVERGCARAAGEDAARRAAAVTSIDAAVPPPAELEGELVHVSGEVESGGVADQRWPVQRPGAARLRRKSEVYQWSEREHTHERRVSSTHVRRERSYSYSLGWETRAHHSANFREAAGHHNPPARVEPGVATHAAADARLAGGGVALPPDLVSQLGGWTPVATLPPLGAADGAAIAPLPDGSAQSVYLPPAGRCCPASTRRRVGCPTSSTCPPRSSATFATRRATRRRRRRRCRHDGAPRAARRRRGPATRASRGRRCASRPRASPRSACCAAARSGRGCGRAAARSRASPAARCRPKK